VWYYRPESYEINRQKGRKEMDTTHTRYAVKDGVAMVTLHRPDQLNAFTATMKKELIQIFREADRDDSVRVIIVTGSGRAFCAGADLSDKGFQWDFKDPDGCKVDIDKHRDGGGQVALAIYRCRKPFIAAINGPAVGVGITMTLPMDIRIAAEDAKIAFAFTRRGVVPEACSSWFLPRIVGISNAAELIYTGRVFQAKEQVASGLFNHIVPRKEVVAKALWIAREIVDNTSSVAVSLSKALLWHGLEEKTPQSVHLIDSKCFYWAGGQRDAKEGVSSFLEKRAPRFDMKVSKEMPDFYPWW